MLESSVKELTEYVRKEMIRLDLKEKAMLAKHIPGVNYMDWELYSAITAKYWCLSDILTRLENIQNHTSITAS